MIKPEPLERTEHQRQMSENCWVWWL